MNTDGSIANSDSVYIAELLQRLRMLKSDLSGIIAHSRNSKSISRLIMASGLLDGALEELSKSVPEHRD
jgi:hypothetical protein